MQSEPRGPFPTSFGSCRVGAGLTGACFPCLIRAVFVADLTLLGYCCRHSGPAHSGSVDLHSRACKRMKRFFTNIVEISESKHRQRIFQRTGRHCLSWEAFELCNKAGETGVCSALADASRGGAFGTARGPPWTCSESLKRNWVWGRQRVTVGFKMYVLHRKTSPGFIQDT